MSRNSFLFANPYNGVLIVLAIIAIFFFLMILKRRAGSSTDRSNICLKGSSLLVLSGLSVLFGIIGYFSELARACCKEVVLPGSSFVTVVCTVTDSPDHIRSMFMCYSQSASIMMTALLTAMISGVLWMILRARARTF